MGGLGIMQNKEEIKNIAKAFEMEYSFPGKVLIDWEANRISEDTYRILRSNGTHRDIKLNEPMRMPDESQVIPVLDPTGVLMVGKHSVIVGEGICHTKHARMLAKPGKGSLSGQPYLLFSQSANSATGKTRLKNLGRATIGKKFDGQDVSLVDGHLLKVGEEIIPIMPKVKDIQLLVMDTKVDNGNLCYINVIVPGEPGNRDNGAKGVFIQPKREGEPAEFIEVVSGYPVVTALFHISDLGNRVDYKFRSGETALKVDALRKQKQECKEIALKVGIDPEDYPEYLEVSEELEVMQNKWQKGSMALSVGPELFRPASFSPGCEP